MKKLFLLLLFCLIPWLSAFAASKGVVEVSLSPQDHADITRIEAYLNDLKNASADFMQIDESGGIMRGTIAIERPGKMRVDYAPPSKDFIIADGDHVHIWNDDLHEQTNVEQGSSLAEFILRDPIKLKGDVVVTRFKRSPARFEMTLVQASDEANGQLTLVFEDNPLKLRQWKVLDPQGHMTTVSLENLQYDVSFPSKIFHFVPPHFGETKGTQAP